MDWKALYLTSTGRLGQRDFWIAWLILFVVSLVARVVPFLGALIALALIYPYVCITAKRLHDFGRSGWLTVIPFAVGVALGVACVALGGAAMMAGFAGRGAMSLAMAGTAGVLALLGLAALIVNLGFLLWVGLSKGDADANAYGVPQAPFFGAGATPTPV